MICHKTGCYAAFKDMEDKEDKIRDSTIDDLESRSLLEEGINLLRYGLKENEIDDFISACINEPDIARLINHKMDVLGTGLSFDK